MTQATTPAPSVLLQNMHLLDELDALPSRQAEQQALAATQALRERLIALCAQGQIVVTPEEIEQAVANYQAKYQSKAPATLSVVPPSPASANTVASATALPVPPPVADYATWWRQLWARLRARFQPSEPVPTDEPTPLPSEWRYERHNPKEGWKTAQVQSTNQFHLASPYQGTQRATLTLKHDPIHGPTVTIDVRYGMFSLWRCDHLVLCKFDTRSPIRVKMKEVNGRLGIQMEEKSHAETFVAVLRKSQRLHVELPFPGEPVTVSFTVAGLDPATLK
jgi:peptidoglycan hydrolase-like protein with peptidoglycan-binding domain